MAGVTVSRLTVLLVARGGNVCLLTYPPFFESRSKAETEEKDNMMVTDHERAEGRPQEMVMCAWLQQQQHRNPLDSAVRVRSSGE